MAVSAGACPLWQWPHRMSSRRLRWRGPGGRSDRNRGADEGSCRL
jgi:hypothetical protein